MKHDLKTPSQRKGLVFHIKLKKSLQDIIFSVHLPGYPSSGSQGNLFKWLITDIIKITKQMLSVNTHFPSFTSLFWLDSDEAI